MDLTSLISSMLPGIIPLAVGSVAGWVANKYKGMKTSQEDIKQMKAMMEEFMPEHKILMNTVKNLNRSVIIDVCNRASDACYITDHDFKNLCDLESSYHQLHGNSYADEVIERTKKLYHNQVLTRVPANVLTGSNSSN